MFRKLTSDNIFTGTQMLGNDFVLVCTADGTIEEVLKSSDAGSDIEYYPGILTPGFINCHCHLDLSHLKGKIPEGTGLIDFLQLVVKERDHASAEEKNKAMFLAMDEMHKAGIVAVGDICSGDVSLEAKKFSSLFWVNFIEAIGFSEAIAEKRFNHALEISDKFRNSLPEFSAQVSPHAAYSVSASLLQKINASTVGGIVTIHNQESVSENELFYGKSGDFLSFYKNLGIDVSEFIAPGISSIRYWLNYFNNRQSIISVHNTFTSEDDMDFIKQKELSGEKFYYCLCPNANNYIEQQLPAVGKLVDRGVKLVLGTDSLASNHNLSILQEIKLVMQNFQVPIEVALQWATSNGAEALGIQDKFGSFTKGLRPGILQLKGKDEFEYAVSRIL